MTKLRFIDARIAIVGAGAIGLDLGAALLDGGAKLALLARGANLTALAERGLLVRERGGEQHRYAPTRYECAADPVELGVQDVVFITLKSGVADGLWPELLPLIGPNTAVVSAMNGLPSWLAHARPAIARHLESPPPATPHPGLAREQLLAAVVNRNATRVEPGVIERLGGAGMVLGELDGQLSPRLRMLAEPDDDSYAFELSAHIPQVLWHKLTINAAFNPLSVMCELPLDEMVTTPVLRERLHAMLDEVHRLGCALELVEPGSFDIEACFERFATQRAGAFTSMLRDLRCGRVLELDRIVRAPLWLAARPSLNHPMPTLARLLNEVEDKAGPLARAQTSMTLA